jgi:hypothetical protein
MRCLKMAQLIKLQDYISRYETDSFRYPGHFIRMKKDGWSKLIDQWEASQLEENDSKTVTEGQMGEKSSFSLKNIFNRNKDNKQFLPELIERSNITPAVQSKDELKQYYLDKLYPIQLKWASSTLHESSFLDNKYQYDPLLKYFLQRFPDSFLVMYFPIFKLKQAIVEGEIIIITPIEIFCIHVMEVNHHITIVPTDNRMWYFEQGEIQSSKLSPLIPLKRTENIVKSICKLYGVELPIKKVILSRTNRIKFQSEPYHTSYVGKDQYEDWFSQMRQISSPLKHNQLKIAESLMKHCQTTAVNRPEWEIGDDEDPVF